MQSREFYEFYEYAGLTELFQVYTVVKYQEKKIILYKINHSDVHIVLNTILSQAIWAQTTPEGPK